MDRAALAAFLRHRRESMQPEDVGLPRGPRRRTTGLRREEIAQRCHMSPDYWSRLEQQRGPQPSSQMVAAIAQGLHLTLDERDHLFRLAGQPPPMRGATDEHISPGLARILDRLQDTPAEIVTELGESLRQTPLSRALTGDTVALTGRRRSLGYRWFTEPDVRARYHPQEHEFLSRLYASGLRRLVGLRGPDSVAAQLAQALVEQSAEFAQLWELQEVGVRPREVKRFLHPEVGALELNCQTLLDPDQSHLLLVYTAEPGSPTQERLQLLSVVAAQG